MQFLANGPDLPNGLLQAHEDGRVAFFCGAGISYPAGLPGFGGLVESIYRKISTQRSPEEDAAYSRNQFDATLNLLEQRVVGQRLTVRAAVNECLQPNLKAVGATDTHEALLKLARDRRDNLRIVTTNFDRLFEHVGASAGAKWKPYTAPMLPIPKRSKWNGLVYLHGLLPKDSDEESLQRLVLTSGDFGLAYLTERWASRFVSELFRNYVVCFVGYSLNDPVLRYMMDALAADRMLGEAAPPAYAFGDAEPASIAAREAEWKAKGVIPILYDVPVGTHDHSALHRTLRVWAETYRDGSLGRERIVASHALTRPSASSKEDDFVGRVLWALSDPSGLPAKRFADANPVPSLEWLEPFLEDRFGHADLPSFGVMPHDDIDEKLKFGLIRRPTSYRRSPWMALVAHGRGDSSWDEVMHQIARWLTRHLGNPKLLLWFAERGGMLLDRFSWHISGALAHIHQLESEGRHAELESMRAQAPLAVPSVPLRTVWELLLAGRIRTGPGNHDLFRWRQTFKRAGLSATTRLELRELLAPVVIIRRPLRIRGEDDREPLERIRDHLDWELSLAAGHAKSAFANFDDPRWQMALPLLLPDLEMLLQDALYLARELGGEGDRSFWDLPSISPHWQNRGFRTWVVLIELLRDAWLAKAAEDPSEAGRIAKDWFAYRLGAFRRLALFAASQDGIISTDIWVEWLLIDGADALWALEMQREVLRLIVLQGSRLTADSRARLESAILAGPRRDSYLAEMEAGQWEHIVDHSVWLRLAKLMSSTLPLGSEAALRMEAILGRNPSWILSGSEREEFSHWMSGTGDPDFEEQRQVDVAPLTLPELIAWLTKSPVARSGSFYEDTWPDVCRSHFVKAVRALCALAKQNTWPIERWRTAFSVWSEPRLVSRSWRFIAPLMRHMPDSLLLPLVHELTRWMEHAAKNVRQHQSVLMVQCQRIMDLPLQEATEIQKNGVPIEAPVTEAINHPIGRVTEALLNLWYSTAPGDGDGLPADIREKFTALCDTKVSKYRHGRVLLSANIIPLYRIDRAWTKANLLPLFDWVFYPTEARCAWEGFLWSPRLYVPLLNDLKTHFLTTASHFDRLGDHQRQYAGFLTIAAMQQIDGFVNADFRVAFAALPQSGLEEAARTVAETVESAEGQRAEYWKNRVAPFLQHVWPKSIDKVSASIAEALARAAIAAEDEFPLAISLIAGWLKPTEHSGHIVELLHGAELHRRYPCESLQLLDAIVRDPQWVPRELDEVVNEISRQRPALANDRRLQRLRQYARTRSV